MRRYATFLILLALAVAAGCQKPGDRFPSETRTVFGVPVTVTFFSTDTKPVDLKPGFDAVFELLNWYESAALTPGENNQLEKIAGGAGRESVPVDTSVYSMLMRALQLNDLTAEAFDLRYGPLLDAWLATGKPAKPAQAEIDTALSLIKTGGMFVAGKSILLSKPNMKFDARGFVDAWAIDRAVEKLNQKGFKAFEIRSPYAVRIVGMPVNEHSRSVKLVDPQLGDSVFATVQMAQGGLAYLPAQQRAANGYRLVVDPRTGELASGASVAMAKDCATAFALAYAISVDGDASKLTEKGAAELMGHIRISGRKPSYTIAADGALKDKFKSLN